MQAGDQRLVLGTAQLGLLYGVSNSTGKPDPDEAVRIVEAAWKGGIRFFDTAQAYGDSEAVLGNAFSALGISASAKVITKLVPDLARHDTASIISMVECSLERLGVGTLHCLMLHREDHLPLLDSFLRKAFEWLNHEGIVDALGVSVYSVEAARVGIMHPLIRVIQVPASIFDRRFENAGIFALARRHGVALHVRSALLQGVLCMPPERLPAYLTELCPFVETFRSLYADTGVPPAPLALDWVLRRYPDVHVLFGSETVAQVRENLDFLSRKDKPLTDKLMAVLDDLIPPQLDHLINPSCWRKQ